jgi:hypothetical protein
MWIWRCPRGLRLGGRTEETRQTTRFYYPDTVASALTGQPLPFADDVSDNNLLRLVVYPDVVTPRPAGAPIGGYVYAHNRQGEIKNVQDPAGSQWTWLRDARGRIARRGLDSVASGFDGRVRALNFVYDGLGRRTRAYSTDVGGAVLDDADVLRDKWGMIANFRMDPDSALGPRGTDPVPAAEVGHDWRLRYPNTAGGGWNQVRDEGVQLPGNMIVTPGYGNLCGAGPGGGIDPAICRVTQVSIGGPGGPSTPVAIYGPTPAPPWANPYAPEDGYLGIVEPSRIKLPVPGLISPRYNPGGIRPDRDGMLPDPPVPAQHGWDVHGRPNFEGWFRGNPDPK